MKSVELHYLEKTDKTKLSLSVNPFLTPSGPLWSDEPETMA